MLMTAVLLFIFLSTGGACTDLKRNYVVLVLVAVVVIVSDYVCSLCIIRYSMHC